MLSAYDCVHIGRGRAAVKSNAHELRRPAFQLTTNAISLAVQVGVVGRSGISIDVRTLLPTLIDSEMHAKELNFAARTPKADSALRSSQPAPLTK